MNTTEYLENEMVELQNKLKLKEREIEEIKYQISKQDDLIDEENIKFFDSIENKIYKDIKENKFISVLGYGIGILSKRDCYVLVVDAVKPNILHHTDYLDISEIYSKMQNNIYQEINKNDYKDVDFFMETIKELVNNE